MKRLLRDIIENPTIILSIIFMNLKFLFWRICGIKTVVYNLHHTYFYDNFQTIYAMLKTNKRVRIYFSYNNKNKLLKKYLLDRIGKWRILSSNISSYLSFDLFLCPEITGPDFPLTCLRTRKLQLYHGMGVYPMYKKLDVLARFDAHFAIGEQYLPFIEKLNKLRKSPAKIYKVGYPKLDLLKVELDKYSGFLEKIPEKPLVLYAPHWNPTGSIHMLGISFLEELAKLELYLIIKPHNYLYFEFPEQNWIERLTDFAAKYENVEFILEPDTQKQYPKADLMITDPGTTSSLEFSLLQRPLFIYNAREWFENNQEHQIELDFYKIAFKFNDIDEFKELISKITSNNMKKEIEQQKIKQIELCSKYLYNFGNATEMGHKAILNELRMV